MMSTSASFTASIGYKANLMVDGQVGYHFIAFLKDGMSMKIIAVVTAIVIIPAGLALVSSRTYLTKKGKITNMKNNPVDVVPASDIFSSDYMIGNVGTPFVMGLAVGYFAKKMLLLTLFLCGAAIVLLFVGEYYGISEISDINLQQAANTATDVAKQSGDFLVKRLSGITSKGVSAAGGFFVGLKLG